MLHRLGGLVLVAALGIFLVGCSAAAIASVLPVPTGPLVTVTTRGGECVNGPCGLTIVIERDGRVHQVAPQPSDLGNLPPDVLGALDAAVNSTNFDAIRARTFTGECPTAYDGQELIYEFGAPTGTERIASCETEIDPNQPVFVAVTAAMGAGRMNQPPDRSLRETRGHHQRCQGERDISGSELRTAPIRAAAAAHSKTNDR